MPRLPPTRSGSSNDFKADAAVRFAVKIERERGHVSEDDTNAVKAAGYDDAQAIEIVLQVALNTWTNSSTRPPRLMSTSLSPLPGRRADAQRAFRSSRRRVRLPEPVTRTLR